MFENYTLIDWIILFVVYAAVVGGAAVGVMWAINRNHTRAAARSHQRALVFDIYEAPMMMHAMMIAGNTARMCGHPQAEERFREFQAYFQDLMPVEASYFDEETWSEIGMALQKSTSFLVYLDEDAHDKRRRAEGRGRWCKNYQLYVQVADKVFWGRGIRYSLPAHESLKAGDPRVKSVFDLLTRLAPATCIGSMNDQSAAEAA